MTMNMIAAFIAGGFTGLLFTLTILRFDLIPPDTQPPRASRSRRHHPSTQPLSPPDTTDDLDDIVVYGEWGDPEWLTND